MGVFSPTAARDGGGGAAASCVPSCPPRTLMLGVFRQNRQLRRSEREHFFTAHFSVSNDGEAGCMDGS